MRHRKHHGSLGLPTGHRRALLANLATALITHGRIETTQAKARAVRPYIEKLITLGKAGDLHSRRQALAKLRHRPVVDRLFNDVAAAYSDRPGGYTRIIKTGFRVGDAAPMALIELVQEEVVAKTSKKKPLAAKPETEKVETQAAVKEEEAVEAKADDSLQAAEDAKPEASDKDKETKTDG